MSIALAPNEAPDAVGPGYDLSPAGLSFSNPALVSLRYGTTDLSIDGIGGVALGVFTAAGWAGLSGGKLDSTSRVLLLPIRTTSPSAAAAGSPVAARSAPNPGDSRFGVGPALAVIKQRNYVPTGGKMTLTAALRFPPTSTSEAFTVRLDAGPRGIAVTWDPPNLGSFSSTSSAVTTFTAPASIGAVTAVVKSQVHVTDAGTNTKYGMSFAFTVIRRNWLFSEIYGINLPCGDGNGDVSLMLYAVGSFVYFHFDDDLSLHAGPNTFMGDPTPTLASCNGCQVSATEKSGNLELRNLTATFLGGSGFFLSGSAFAKNASPPYKLSADPPRDACKGSVEGVDLLVLAILPPGKGAFWPLSNESVKTSSKILLGTKAIDLDFEWGSIPGNIPPGQ
jgi:hypothetical protein